MTVSLLKQLCVLKVASLLKSGVWIETFEGDFYESNPFASFPSDVIHDLIEAVIQITPPGTLQVSDLYPLLISGRVKHFKMDDVLLSTEELISILMSLSISAFNLISIVLKDVFCSDCPRVDSMSFKKSAALDCLITMSPNLEILESSIEFDLKSIRHVGALKKLTINFVPQGPLHNILGEINGKMMPNDSLTFISVFENQRHVASLSEIAKLLTYCRELIYIENDISRSLDYLHLEELTNGTLVQQYKLKSCILGNAFLDHEVAVPSCAAVEIATLTCPLLSELDILVKDHKVIVNLGDFQHLSSILIQWEPMTPGDFRTGILPFLKIAGGRLKLLNFLNFSHVDFSSIASLCPIVEHIKIEFENEASYSDFPETCLEELQSLYLDSFSDAGASERTIMQLLSKCNNLKSLVLRGLSFINDRIFQDVFSKSLSQLKEITIFTSMIGAEGLRSIVLNCKDLEYLHFNSSSISFEEAAAIVHSVNDKIIFRSDI